MNANGAIGIFDSGVGGLSVIPAVRKYLPGENLVYFGDTARMPYGNKSKARLRKYAGQITRFLIDKDVKAIIVACNTMSATILPELEKEYEDIIFSGMILPTVEDIAEKIPQNATIYQIATEMTVASGRYSEKISALRPDLKIKSKACPLLVNIAEEGLQNGEVAQVALKHYLRGWLPDEAADDDYLLLGCTHYPIFEEILNREYGGFKRINPSDIVVRPFAERLKRAGLAAGRENAERYKIYAGKMSDNFKDSFYFYMNKANAAYKELEAEKIVFSEFSAFNS